MLSLVAIVEHEPDSYNNNMKKIVLVSNTVVLIMWFLLIAINIDLNCYKPGAKVRFL